MTDLQEQALNLYDAGLNIYPSRKTGTDYGHQHVAYRRIPPESVRELFATDCNISVLTGGFVNPYPFVIYCPTDSTFEDQIKKIKPFTKGNIWAVKRNRGGDIWLSSRYGRVENTKTKDGIQVLGNQQSKRLLPPSINGNVTYTWHEQIGDIPPVVDMEDLKWLSLKRETVKRVDKHPQDEIREEHWRGVRQTLEKRFRHWCAVFGIQVSDKTVQMRIDKLLLRKKRSAVPRRRRDYIDKVIAYMAHRVSFTGNVGRLRLAVLIALLSRIQIEHASSGKTWGKKFGVSNREIAEMVDIDKDTATSHLQWFCNQQLLKKISSGNYTGRSIYEFTSNVIRGGLSLLSVNGTLRQNLYIRELLEQLSRLDPLLLSPQALTITGAQIYVILDKKNLIIPKSPDLMSMSSLMKLTGLSHSTIKIAYERLESRGLVQVLRDETGRIQLTIIPGSDDQLDAAREDGLQAKAIRRTSHNKKRDQFIVSNLKKNLNR